jgi:predicted nucleotidyltransferase
LIAPEQQTERLLEVLADSGLEFVVIGGVAEVPAVRLNLLPGREFSVIGLDALIEVKAHVGRGKDKILEEELRAVRARRAAGKLGKPPETV